MENFKGKGVIKWALSIGIIIVLNLFFSVAIETVYPQPQYDTFCTQTQVTPIYEDENSCVAAGGQWNPGVEPKRNPDGSIPVEQFTAAQGYCNVYFTCNQEYQDAQELYARNVFVILIVLGALSIAAGFMLRISPAVSAGLSYGGVLSFVIAAIRYWGEAGDLVRLAIVAAALVALIAIGVKKFKE